MKLLYVEDFSFVTSGTRRGGPPVSGNMLSCQLELAETPGGSHWIVGQPPITKSEYHRGGHQKNGRLSPLLANKFLAITDFNIFFLKPKTEYFLIF